MRASSFFLIRFIAIFFLLVVKTMFPTELSAKSNLHYHYEISWKNPVNHLYQISLRTEKASGHHTDFKMPAWRPGRYILQNFAAAISKFEATDAQGNALEWHKIDKDTWRVSNPKDEEIVVKYLSYANIQEQASSYLGPEMAYFNPFTFCMYVDDRYEVPCTVTVPSMPQNWKVASQLIKTDKHNVFTAPSYHYLVDSPTILSPSLTQFTFKQDGVNYYVHFQGNYKVPPGEEKEFITGLGKIMREHTAVFGELPLQEYHFIYLLLPYNYRSATEHSYSAMYAVPETVTANARALGELYSITSHEVFHLWNIKRLRPAPMVPYRYDKEAYTNLYWLAEGFTSYYDDLGITRAGLISEQQFLDDAGKLLGRIENSETAQFFSVDEISFDSWLYTSRYVMPYINGGYYYDQGARLGLLLDLKLRDVSKGKVDLDAVMKHLYETYYKKDKGVPDDGVEKACTELTGTYFAAFFKQHAASAGPYDLASIFEPLGLQINVTDEPNMGLRKIGIDRVEQVQGGYAIVQQRPFSDCANAGIADRSIITKIDGKAVADVDLDAFFNDVKIGQNILITAVYNNEPKDYRITYSGKNAPKKYTIVPKPGADLSWMKSWLGSKAKR